MKVLDVSSLLAVECLFLSIYVLMLCITKSPNHMESSLVFVFL